MPLWCRRGGGSCSCVWRLRLVRCRLLLSLLLCGARRRQRGGSRAGACGRHPLIKRRGSCVEAVMECGMFDGKFECRNVSRSGHAVWEKGQPRETKPMEARPEPDSPDVPTGWRRAQAQMPVQGAPTIGTTCQRRHGRHAAQLSLPGETRNSLGGICVRYTASACSKGLAVERPPGSLPGRRGKDLLHHAPRRNEGLLLRHLRQVLGIDRPVSVRLGAGRAVARG